MCLRVCIFTLSRCVINFDTKAVFLLLLGAKNSNFKNTVKNLVKIKVILNQNIGYIKCFFCVVISKGIHTGVPGTPENPGFPVPP